MSQDDQNLVVEASKKVADFIEVDFKISIFGHTILEWHFPPKRKA